MKSVYSVNHNKKLTNCASHSVVTLSVNVMVDSRFATPFSVNMSNCQV